MQCPVCQSPAVPGYAENFDKGLQCVRCGAFTLSMEADSMLPAAVERNPALRSVMSHYIRLQQQRDGRIPYLGTDNVEALTKQRRSTPAEQRDALILWIGSNQPSSLEHAASSAFEVAAAIGADKVRSDAEDGLQWLNRELENEELYRFDERTGNVVRLLLTMKGWELFNELQRREEDSRRAFIAMKFGNAELDAAIEDHFRSAVEATGFTLQKLTDNQGAGLIDNQIRVAIRTAAFVVVDLSDDNNGAYFEAGFAEGIGLDVIYLCKADKFRERKTHFDTNHMVTIPWDPADLPAAARQLKQTIRNTLPTKARMTDN